MIKHITPEDIPELVELVNACLGKGYVTEGLLLDYFNNGNYTTLCFCNGDIKGVAVGEIMDKSNRTFYSKYCSWKIPRNTGFIKTLAVKEGFRRQGIGKDLVNTLCEELGCKHYFATVWDSRDSAIGILVDIGFRMKLAVCEYWSDVDHECPLCGYPCHCTAMFFAKGF